MSRPPANSRALLVKAGLAVVALAVLAWLLARGVDLKGLVKLALDGLRDAGPVTFFVAMAVLPALGAPMALFVLPAVAAFGPQLGTTTVVLLALLAITANFCLAYALARRWLRPLVQALVERLGYRLPDVDSADAIDLLIVLRVTPGVPFVMQNFLAGLAQAPFGKYFLVSAAIAWPINLAFLLFGEALLQGRGRAALLGLAAIVAIAALLHLVRRHYAKRKAAAS